MRCINIGFKGYKRLADTSCNTDGKMIAFVGPNEAGKSSVLEGLDWLSHGDGELHSSQANRTAPPAEHDFVVWARFALSEDDLAAIAQIPGVGKPATLTSLRSANGELRFRLEPPLSRPHEPFDNALKAFDEFHAEHLLRATEDQGTEAAHVDDEVAAWNTMVHEVLSDPNGEWSNAHNDEFEEICNWLRVNGVPPRAEKSRENFTGDEVAELLESARSILQAPPPNTQAGRKLIARAPEFLLFTQEDRDLSSTYNLSDATTRQGPPRALANLLWIAGLDLERLWSAIQQGDTGKARTIERRANEQLVRKLGSRWGQDEIDVQFNVSGVTLEILVAENATGGADTPFGERSDGLRMFVSLVAFLARHNFEVPPILLVDEAETHLHYDAQADLLEVLAQDVEASQVFYTTHSPGCLPRDLGTGVRLVAPSNSQKDASEIRNDFWTNSRPGFTPLLFAMGAGAAAFSAFRRAVLTEGASDMILLPSLLRLATGSSDLSYQVAPGLANHHGSGIELEETAARVVYLLDGDAGGKRHKTNLVKLGINENRIFQLAPNKALEDYVDPQLYLSVVNEFLASSSNPGNEVSLDDLDPGIPVGKAVENWCRTHGVKAPSKTAVASRLVNNRDVLCLRPDLKHSLREVHNRMMSALTTT